MYRRHFIKSGAIATGALAFPFHLSAQNKKIKLAILGTGWWGTDILLKQALTTDLFEIVALCDVNSTALNNASDIVEKAGLKKPKLYSDYRKMYDQKGIEAVVIATPTHWHALQFIDACNKGIHVFLEKPISYDIREGQAMLAAHSKAGNVVLVDFPRMMVDTNQRVKEFIGSGEMGKVLQVKANINNPTGTLVEKEIPDFVDFETYCGPAPKVKYMCSPNKDTINWRGIKELNRGILFDWGIHYVQNIRAVMGLELPDSAVALGGTVKNNWIGNPDQLKVQFMFGDLPVEWEHKTWGYSSPNPDRNIGIYYYGEKGTLFEGDLGFEFYSKNGEKSEYGPIDFNPGKPEYAPKYDQMFQSMFAEFAQGIREKSNEGITNKLTEGFNTTTTVGMADIAFKTSSLLKLDKESMSFMNNDKANNLLKRDYREPYQHPFS